MTRSDIKMGSLTGWSYHQAGHLVAATLRGVDPAYVLKLADLMPGDVVSEVSRPFIAFAGPWAERECGAADVELLEGEDAFDPAWMSARCSDQDVVDDANNKVATILRRAGADQERAWGWLPGVVASWRGELREVWPVIRWAAAQLRDEMELSAAQVQTRLRAAGAPRRG